MPEPPWLRSGKVISKVTRSLLGPDRSGVGLMRLRIRIGDPSLTSSCDAGIIRCWRYSLNMGRLTKALHHLVLATLVTAVIWPLVASPVHPAGIPVSPRDAHPLINQELARKAFLPPPAGLKPAPSARLLSSINLATTRPSREVFGFVTAATIGYGDIGYTTWDFSMLTTVAYFGLHINWDGSILHDNAGWAIWNSSTVSDLVQAAHSQGVKVVVTLMLFDSSPHSPVMCSGLGDGDTTISQTLHELAAKGADGVNLDYEGVNDVCVANHQTTQSMFITFVKKMRAALPVGTYLSIDTY